MPTIDIDPLFDTIEESATLAINRRARRMRADGTLVAHFGFGESPFPVPEPMRFALMASAGEKSYLPGEGLPALRQTAARFFDTVWSCEFAAERIVVGPGSKELLFDLLAVLSGPVMVPTPAWVSYAPQAKLLRKPFLPIPTTRDSGYRLQPAALQAQCRAHPGQKLLILNNPVNPTGTVYSPDELAALAEVCRRESVIVIADEIYGLVNFGAVARCSMASLLPERTIVTTGLSKIFAAGGWRLGIAAIPDALDALCAPLRAMISETYSCVSAPVQYGAIAAFEYGDAIGDFVERTTQIHALAAGYLHRRFESMGLNCPPPEGAFYLFPDFDEFRTGLAARGIIDSVALARQLLTEAGVAVLPGTDFGDPPAALGVRVASVDYDGARALSMLDHSDDPQILFPQLVAGCDALASYLADLSG